MMILLDILMDLLLNDMVIMEIIVNLMEIMMIKIIIMQVELLNDVEIIQLKWENLIELMATMKIILII